MLIYIIICHFFTHRTTIFHIFAKSGNMLMYLHYDLYNILAYNIL